MLKKSRKRRTYRMRSRRGTPRLQRMLKHIYNSQRDRGVSHEVALRVAAAKVNQYRRVHGMLVGDVGRKAWYPGKKIVKRGKGRKVA